MEENNLVQNETSTEENAERQTVLEENELVNNESVIEENDSKTSKQQSNFQLLLENLKERLSVFSTLVYTFFVNLISIFAFLLFDSIRRGTKDNISVTNSCLILEIFFMIIFIIFIAAFVSSIVLNIKRKKSDRR